MPNSSVMVQQQCLCAFSMLFLFCKKSCSTLWLWIGFLMWLPLAIFYWQTPRRFACCGFLLSVLSILGLVKSWPPCSLNKVFEQVSPNFGAALSKNATLKSLEFVCFLFFLCHLNFSLVFLRIASCAFADTSSLGAALALNSALTELRFVCSFASMIAKYLTLFLGFIIVGLKTFLHLVLHLPQMQPWKNWSLSSKYHFWSLGSNW